MHTDPHKHYGRHDDILDDDDRLVIDAEFEGINGSSRRSAKQLTKEVSQWIRQQLHRA